ncbi:MAG: beta-ketoacyl-ACP synthase III [Aeromonadaceae bacterium]
MSMYQVVLTGSGLHVPPYEVTNQQLADVYNRYVHQFNQENGSAIEAGQIAPLKESSPDFIEELSGIRTRHFLTREGILDPDVMQPMLPATGLSRPSFQLQLAIPAIQQALDEADVAPDEIDALYLASSLCERTFPSVAIELQAFLGAKGMACAVHMAACSALYALQQANLLLQTGAAQRALIVVPEINSAQLDFRDRFSHFLFGDGCAVLLLEREDVAVGKAGFVVRSCRLESHYSTLIHNLNGDLLRTHPESRYLLERLYRQAGPAVGESLLPLVCTHIQQHLEHAGLAVADMTQFWLHQIDRHFQSAIAQTLGLAPQRLPSLLAQYGNLAAAGAPASFHHFKHILAPGEHGIMAAYGAGYAMGSILLTRRAEYDSPGP